jgi:hypothetical protein
MCGNSYCNGARKKIESIKTIITIANSSECCENIVKAKQLLKKKSFNHRKKQRIQLERTGSARVSRIGFSNPARMQYQVVILTWQKSHANPI